MKQLPIYLAAVFLAVSTYFIGASKTVQPVVPSFGSVNIGNEYYSTSTAGFAGVITTETNCSSALGSVIIPQTGTGWMDLYDATTTNINLRTGQKATSTIKIGSVTYATAGVFTFDSQLRNGLTMVFTGVTGAPTSTITCR